MKSRAWITPAVGIVALALSGGASAQTPMRTTLARAIELVDAHLAKARDEADPDLGRRLQIEGYLALLALPGQHRPYEAADALRRIDETLPEHAGEDRRVITQGLRAARNLAEQRSDLDRIVQIDRQYYEAILPAFIESYHFRKLARSNDAEAMTWFVRSENVDKAGVGPAERIRELCAAAYRDLARGVAQGLAEPEYDLSMGPLLVELGATKEAEQRADRLLSRNPAAGAAILERLAVAAGRRGDLDEVARLIRKLGDALGGVLFDPKTRSVPYDRSECAPTVLEPGFTNRWLERSIEWSAMEPLHGHSYPKTDEWPVLLGLAGAVAAAEASPRSVALIDELLRVFEKNLRDSGVDLANMMILAHRPIDYDTSSARFVAVSWLATWQGLRLARVAAGGEIDDAAARDLSLPWVMTFFSAFPNSSLPKRLATMSEVERRRIAAVKPRVVGPVQWVSMVLAGMGAEARALANAEPSVRSLDDWRLLHPIEMMENAGLRSRAVAALDAYVSVSPARDLAVQRLLMVQGQTDKAKAMAREFMASGSSLYMAPEAFIGAMLLRELRDRTDVPSMVAMQDGLDAVNTARRLVAVVDALAWQPSDDEIRSAIGRTWPAFAQLSDEDAACLRATLTGVQAVGLARAGDFEAAVALVSGRTLDQRRFCGVGQGTNIFNPVFDIRFLAQEWVWRGHAKP